MPYIQIRLAPDGQNFTGNRAYHPVSRKIRALRCLPPTPTAELARPTGKGDSRDSGTRISQPSSKSLLGLDLNSNALVRDWLRPRCEQADTKYPVPGRNNGPPHYIGETRKGSNEASNLQEYSSPVLHTQESASASCCNPDALEPVNWFHDWAPLREGFKQASLPIFSRYGLSQSELADEINSSPVLQKFLAKLIQWYC